MPDAQTQFSVVIPHYNDVIRLTRCLEALMDQADPNVQVIVADNGSDQDLSDVQKRWPAVRFVDQPQKGAGPARNAGAAEVTSDWIAFLDADCIPSPSWLDAARRIATKGEIFGGLVTIFDETEPPRSGAQAFETVFAFQIESYLEKGFLPSCQLIMARQDFERVGGFKVDVSEDVDWSRRATSIGLRLNVSRDLRISHPSRSDWAALKKKWRRLTLEEFLTEVSSIPSRLRWAVKALLMPLSALVHMPRVMRHSALSGVEKRRAVATLLRLRMTRMIWMLKQTVTGRP